MSKAWSRDMQLDPGTFGGSPACHVLVDMMNNNIIPVFEKHRVLSFINRATNDFKWISLIPHVGVKNRAMAMMRDSFYERIDKMPYPEKFNSYLKNVITHHFRRYLREVI
jgi:hypothetical protein